MKKKPAQQLQFRKNRSLSALILCGLIFQSVCPSDGLAESMSDELAPIDLSLSGESADLSSTDTISMSFDGALLKDVLLLFSQQSGLNFVASQEAESKKVTVYFENVSPKDALDSIISANGLSYTKKPGSDIYIVAAAAKSQPAVLVTKVIQLKFMRLSNSPLDVGGQVTINDLTKSSAPSSSDSGGGGSSSGGGSDKGADRIVQRLLTPAGKITTDTHTNSLIITDTPDNLKQIEKVLDELDVPPSQVVLEVHIMEVSKNMASDIGISWGGNNGAILSLSGGARTTSFPFNTGDLLGGKKHLVGGQFIGDLVADSTEGTVGVDSGDPTPAQTLYGLVNAQNLAATLHYIETDSKTKVLARPRVLTQNNEAATIKLVTNAAIGSNTVTTGEGAAASTTEEAERSDIGVAMRLTPQINQDDTILLFLEPAISTFDNSTVIENTADVTTRLVRTMARIKDNQTLVIGGLITGQGNESVTKVPILGDLPWIGRAFRYNGDNNADRELLIFVTPHIVRGSSSLGSRSATAQGEDTSVKRVLSEFMEKEMDSFTRDFEASQAKQDNFFTQDQEFIRASERKSVNPAVEQQMTHALDSLSPQIVDQKIGQAMDALSAKNRG